MRAVVIEEFADPCAPVVRDIAEPVVGAGEVLVDLVAADLQPLDRQIARGLFPGAGPLPLVAGVSGVARATDGGLNVVLAEMTGMGLHRGGCFAERFVCEPRQLVPVPEGAAGELDPVHVAAVANAGMHARRALFDVAKVQPGTAVLVLGASGSFGRAAVQLAAAAGIQVVAAGRRTSGIPTGPSITVIPLGEPDAMVEAVLAATDYKGADAVLDPLGGAWTGAAIKACALDARHVLLGNQAGVVAPIIVPTMLLREHTIIGLNGFRISEAEQRRLMTASLHDLAAGVLTADVGAVFALQDAANAYARTGPGRVILTVA